MTENCLCCQSPVTDKGRYHPRCLRAVTGGTRPLRIPFGVGEIAAQALATEGRMSLSGVQMKLSVRIHGGASETVGVGGTHLLKPETPAFPELPSNENLGMNLAAAAEIAVPAHGLFPLSDGKLAYLVRRFDRVDGTKRPVETFFQILDAEDKYRGSLEGVGKAVRRLTRNAGLETVNFFERVVFSFLMGNGDMHLKNWALLADTDGAYALAPGYDFVCSKIYLPQEEDSALTLNGKRNKLAREDFTALAGALDLPPKVTAHVLEKFRAVEGRFIDLCATSELSPTRRNDVAAVIRSRYRRLYA